MLYNSALFCKFHWYYSTVVWRGMKTTSIPSLNILSIQSALKWKRIAIAKIVLRNLSIYQRNKTVLLFIISKREVFSQFWSDSSFITSGYKSIENIISVIFFIKVTSSPYCLFSRHTYTYQNLSLLFSEDNKNYQEVNEGKPLTINLSAKQIDLFNWAFVAWLMNVY